MHPDIKCLVTKIKGNLKDHYVEVYIEEDNVSDMTGTIEVAVKLDPEVRNVFVFCDNWPQVSYRKDEDSEKWEQSAAQHGCFL